jgi:hypothetical protein
MALQLTFWLKYCILQIVDFCKQLGGGSMGMTNKQFQGFIRLALGWLDKALEESPDNKNLIALRDIFQSMLEDD